MVLATRALGDLPARSKTMRGAASVGRRRWHHERRSFGRTVARGLRETFPPTDAVGRGGWRLRRRHGDERRRSGGSRRRRKRGLWPRRTPLRGRADRRVHEEAAALFHAADRAFGRRDAGWQAADGKTRKRVSRRRDARREHAPLGQSDLSHRVRTGPRLPPAELTSRTEARWL